MNAWAQTAALLMKQELIDIQIEPPQIAVRDRLEEARLNQILVRNGAMSVQRMALRHGLDPEQEQRWIADFGEPQVGAISDE